MNESDWEFLAEAEARQARGAHSLEARVAKLEGSVARLEVELAEMRQAATKAEPMIAAHERVA